MGAIGVQMQAVVVTPPHGADRVRLFEDDRIDPARLERRGDGEAGGSGADDDRVAGIGQAGLLRLQAAASSRAPTMN